MDKRTEQLARAKRVLQQPSKSVGILADHEIRALGFIKNMVEGEKRPGTISYGLSTFGYDIRVSDKFKIFTNVYGAIIDPKEMRDECFVEYVGPCCIIPPNSYVLAESIEYFEMPDDVLAICLGKSTYARAGISINCTPIENGFKGTIVVEIANNTPLPAKIYANEGIAQLIFLRGNTPENTYETKSGKYQNQRGIVLPRID